MVVTISKAKSKFYWVNNKFVGYICDVTYCHADTSKVLKILDLLKYIDITFPTIYI